MTDSNFLFFRSCTSIFESLLIEQLEIRIYEKRPQTRSNVAMATNIFSQGAPWYIFKKIEKVKIVNFGDTHFWF